MADRVVKTEFYVNKLIDGSLSYWKFLPTATPQTFADAYEIIKTQLSRSSVTKLMVVVEMAEAWNRNVQHLWIQTGDLADRCGIEQWGVVSPTPAKVLTIRHLVGGAGERERGYTSLVSDSENDVLEWLGVTQPVLAAEPADVPSWFAAMSESTGTDATRPLRT